MMRAPVPSEPNYTFPTYQVPQVSAMRGRAPPVQVATRTAKGVGAVPPRMSICVPSNVQSVIFGSSCPTLDNSNLRMQSVTDNCLLNSVTVPKIQRNVAHNNSDKLACKSGAFLLLGQDIPGNQKADKIPPGLTTTQYLSTTSTTTTTNINTICNNYYTLDRLIECSKRTRELQRSGVDLPAMRLLGGGESSINTGTSGWGTPPSQQASNNNANTSSGWGTANPANQNNAGTQQWNNNANRPPTAGPGNTNQDANKSNSNLSTNGQPVSSQGNNGWGQPGQKPPAAVGVPPPTTPANNPSNPSNASPPGQVPPANSTKQQLEQLTTMREAIFSQDGWGGYVNQDTNWDIPESPEPQNMKMAGSGGGGGGGSGAAPPWKPNVNNGTELWEANLRNGGQPPPQPQQKTPWGHTPSTNIGGTWGEDDDVADSSNVWTGVPSAQPQQWSGGGGGANNANSTMWGGPKKENDWSGGGGGGGGSQGGGGGGGQGNATSVGGGGGGWGDPRANDPRPPAMDPREMRPDPRDMRTNSTDPMRLLDPREIRIVSGGDMRGDPRGITGRLNGSAAEGFWSQAGPQTGTHHVHHQAKMPVGPGNGGGGWEEPSPPAQRRNMPNYDDGTSLWGNPQQGSHWKDLPTGGGGAGMSARGGGGGVGGGGAGGPPGMAGPNVRPGMKPPTTGGEGNGGWRNGNWGDEPGAPVNAGGWGGGEEVVSSWPKQKPMGGSGQLWGENEFDWKDKQSKQQTLSKEVIWNSKQFRLLAEMGFKKEDVESALRIRDMSMEDALDMLNSIRQVDGWRAAGRHEEHFDQPFPGQRNYPSGPTGQMNFPPGGSTPSLLNSMGNSSAGGGNNSLINNMSPAIVQKMLSQVGGSQGFGSSGNGGAGSRNMSLQSQPSTAQLRMLVQQIQMAVQTGYLNHQILNQPLAPQTLILLNQLLQQIKNLHNLGNQQNIAQSQCLGGKPSNALLQWSVYITKTKQQIANLQNQIASQQANYVKQQQLNSNDIFKTNTMHESINSLPSNFGDLSIKDSQQSRLTQWKLPALDKDEDFSRAPGSASKPLVPSHSSPNLNPLSQNDGLWSSGRNNVGDSGWPDSVPGDNSANDIKDPKWPAPTQPSLTDLVPEFEPGKPWKGNQKSIEDDPSITPGSVVMSPLSLPTIKDSELFMNPSKSPPAVGDTIQPLSLSSSTWTFNTSSSTTSPQIIAPSSKGGVLGPLGNQTKPNSSDLWGAPPTKRGPPPGLATKGGNTSVNGWPPTIGSSVAWGGTQRSNWGGSQWLLLRNLTAQIDGSTLRTLCMQHGPLLSFHLYLHQCFALAKYSTHEEAVKAQTALNNCVLGNTTILAENPSDWEATTLLQQVANQQGGSSGGWRGGGGGGGGGTGKQPNTADTWSTGWSNTPSASLWGSTPLDTADQARATPSSLQSYLPGDLLGGESM